jgi:hypothetical protein
MAAVLVSNHHFLFVCCPWCSAFFHHFVDCYVINLFPLSFFLKPFKSRFKIGVVAVVVGLVVAVVLAVSAIFLLQKWRLCTGGATFG